MDTLKRDAESYDEVVALLALDLAPGAGLVGIRRLVGHFGSAVEVLARRPAVCRAIWRGYAPPAPEYFRAAAQAVEAAARYDMRIVKWGDAAYPARLLHLHDPPPVLFLRGRSALLDQCGVTVVGSRRATARGRDVAERLGRVLAGSGTCVTSGLALGIDGAAHRGALATTGDTIAVLGRGADEAYPPSHRRIFGQVVERGLVVSEFVPGAPPLPHHFPRRNRLLAALSEVTVVVEAGARSGALITVDHALDLGREVWAVPGPIDVAACRGSNRLLADGARPLVDLNRFAADLAGESPAPAAALDGPGGRLLAELTDEPLGIDELAARMGLPTARVLGLLTELELGGAVRRLPGMRFGVAA